MNLPFFIRLIISSSALSLVILLIHLLKKKLKGHITIKAQYYIWFLFLILLTTPFISMKNITSPFLKSWLPNILNKPSIHNSINVPSKGAQLNTPTLLKDFSITPTTTFYESIDFLLYLVWIVGIIVVLSFTIKSLMGLKKIKASLCEVEDSRLKKLFTNILILNGVKKKISLKASPLIDSPIILGVASPTVVVPIDELVFFSDKEIQYILMHELQHYKNKDIIINYFLCFFQIIYWFNPLIWWSIREMKIDREVSCDIGVLNTLKEGEHIEYGKTLINFADSFFTSSPFSIVNDIGGSKHQIKRRIIEISSFKKDTLKKRINSFVALSLLSIIIFSLIPILSVRAIDDSTCNIIMDKYKDINLSSYFKDMEGSFVLYDPETDDYIGYNKDVIKKRVSPNSTYKIYSGLFALENNIITTENSTLPWDGEIYTYPEWNKDQTLRDAMSTSNNWYFSKLNSSLGLQTLKNYLRHIKYGNYDISGGIKNFWTQSSLKISPLEQVNLLKALFNNEFNFKDENIDEIKKSLLINSSDGISIYGKTGTGSSRVNDSTGWFIGAIELPNKTYFFSTNLLNHKDAKGSEAIKITEKILNSLKPYN